MNFEDFKNRFEVFRKIDRREVLNICKQQYESLLLKLEDDKYFEPLLNHTTAASFPDYIKNLYFILGYDKISPEQILFLSQPSFGPESLLKIEKTTIAYNLTHISLVESYWGIYRTHRFTTTARVTSSNSNLTKEIGDMVFAIMESSMQDARPPYRKGITLDGVMFKFSKIINDRRVDVFKHSPDEYSTTGKIIELMSLLTDLIYINPKDRSEEKILSAIRSISDLE